MSNRETLDYDPVDALIEQGRRELTDGKIDKARWCFEEVLRRRPDEPRALLGLSYAARKSDMPPSMDEASEAEQKDQLADAASVLSVDVEVVVLVREKRYGEALVKLRAELSKRPEDPVLLRSIAHLEQHIRRASARPSEESAAADQEAQTSIPKLRPVTIDAPVVAPNVEATSPTEETKAETEADVLEAATPADDASSTPADNTSSTPADNASSTPADNTSPPSPLASKTSEVEGDSTKPFELVKVAPAPKNGEDNVGEALLKPAPEGEERLESSEPRMADFASSGTVALADEEPSVPALGSLPAAPAPAENMGSGATWWIFALLAVAALALALALR